MNRAGEKALRSHSTLVLLLQHSSSLIHVFFRNTLHAIYFQLNICSSRYCIWYSINSLFMHLRMRRYNEVISLRKP